MNHTTKEHKLATTTTSTGNDKHCTKILQFTTIINIFCIALTLAAPSPSSDIYAEYVYNYESSVASGPTEFRFTAKAHFELLYTGGGALSGQLVRLRLTEPAFYAGHKRDKARPLVTDRSNPTEHHLYAHIVTLSNGTAYIKELFTHQLDTTTFRNIKKSILLNLLPTNHHLRPSLNADRSGGSGGVCTDDNNEAQPELFSPDSISQVSIIAKPSVGAASSSLTAESSPLAAGVFQSVEGHQNVSFRPRVFGEAESYLTTSFKLELFNALTSDAHEKFDQANSIGSAMKLFDRQNYLADTIELQREKRVCLAHHCGKNLTRIYQDYKDSLTDASLASVEASVAFLRILDRLRDAQGTGVTEILYVLKKMRGLKQVQGSFLDILAAARTKDSITAALKFIKLAKNNNLDSIAERFLSALSVAAKTVSKMHLKRTLKSPYYFTQTSAPKLSLPAKSQLSQMASVEFIAQKLLDILEQTPARNWQSYKLRWSTLLTLATLVNANNQEHNFENTEDELNHKVSRLLLDELSSCQQSDTDCRIVVIQAIGNVGHLGNDQFEVLKNQALNSGKRESISAIRALRDLLENQAKDKPLNQEFYTSLNNFLLRVVYDDTQETTARVLASEMIVRFVPNSLAAEQLLYHLPSFKNNELTTMIYSRMQSLRPDSLAKYNDNWYWKSCIINGASTSFVRTIAKTNSMNASYGVNVELKDKVKFLKESSFDLFLDTKKRTQDLFSLSIFARGMSKFLGGEPEDESGTAGMTLRLLGSYLRPYIFFKSLSELMGHILMGTASEPTTVFNGNLLLIDHLEGYPLISGFVAEQQMHAVLSIDVSGDITISTWYRNSHSNVRTKASVIVQASQSVYTSYDNFLHSHLFSFGGQALIDFVTDSDFGSSPKICLQVTQPEFMVRYNSRRYYQMMTNRVRRKITRRNYFIGAKSYSLNSENNIMCLLVHNDKTL